MKRTVWGHEISSSLPSTYNSLNGKHLLIIWPRWEGNPKGLSGPLKGGVIVDFLADRFNFTYEMVRVTENRLEPPKNGRGLFNYLWDQQCDLLVSSISLSAQRIQIVDLTVPWVYDTLAFIIPVITDDAANTDAVLKPFQWPVWVMLLIAIGCVILVLHLLQKHILKQEKNINNQTERIKKTASPYLYVFGNLLSQGGPCTSNQIKYRLVAGGWTLAAFVLVQAYTSTLFTYVIAPIRLPLINSVYDIADNPDIQLFVKKGGTMDTIIHSNTTLQSTLYKKLRDRVDLFPQSRCDLVSECISSIRPGTKNVFADGKPYQLDAIKENFEKTGNCEIQLAKDGFFTLQVTFALAKNSPYTNTINQGLLELFEIGLVDYWELWFRPMPAKCMENVAKSGYKQPNNGKHPPLSLKNLTGAFIILSVGLALSFVAFVYEKIRAIILDPNLKLKSRQDYRPPKD